MNRRERKQARKRLIQAAREPDVCRDASHPRYYDDVLVETGTIPDAIYGQLTYTFKLCSLCGKRYNASPAMA